MTLYPFIAEAGDGFGNVTSGALVEVRDRVTLDPVEVFATEAGDPFIEPPRTGADGQIALWIESGRYEWRAGNVVFADWQPVDIAAAGAAVPGPEGPPGPPGEPGEPGPPGTGGDPVEYLHDQAVASAEWTITHGLGRYPALLGVVDTAGTEVHMAVSHQSSDVTVLTSSAPFSGKARLL